MSKESLFSGIKSGFYIALIALPLCLGIAMASSCPPIAGVITAIVGGMVSSLIGGCRLSIKGPAAGLIVIVMATVVDLGAGDLVAGYKRMLAVGVVAACIQIIFALMGAARLGKLMPPSIIHGMLAAIGVIILSKQIHILVGSAPHGKSTFELIGEIPTSILNINPELAFIGFFTLFCMILIPLIPNRAIKSIPPAALALLVVVPLGLYWHLSIPHAYEIANHTFQVGPKALVNIPDSLLASLVFPDFSILLDMHAYKFVAMLALVGSIESVLTVIAVDSISKAKTKSDLNRDLMAVGVGNLIAALIGGLPMISEVVRSKANIDNGARDHWSNFFHGLILLLAITFAGTFIRQIPLAALAAMLMVTGVRLASPSMFFKTYSIGRDQLMLFLATMGVTLASDLLMGVMAGLFLKLLLNFKRGVKPKHLFSSPLRTVEEPKNRRIILQGPAVFSNYFSVQKEILEAIKASKIAVIDFSEATLVDHTTLASLYSLRDELGEQSLSIIGLDKLKPLSNHHLATHRFA